MMKSIDVKFLKKIKPVFLNKKLALLVLATALFYSCKPLEWEYSFKPDLSPVSAGIGEAPAYENLIKPYRDEMSARINTVIGSTEADITRNSGAESPLGNFTADMMYAHARLKLAEQVDFSLLTIGGLRADIAKGDITVGDMFEIMPFENELASVEIDSIAMNKLFQYIHARRVVAVGNIRIQYSGKMPVKVEIGGQPYDPNRKYRVLMSDYLATGGDGMGFFVKSNDDIRFLGSKVRDLFIEHIKEETAKGKKISSQKDGRVVFTD